MAYNSTKAKFRLFSRFETIKLRLAKIDIQSIVSKQRTVTSYRCKPNQTNAAGGERVIKETDILYKHYLQYYHYTNLNPKIY